MFAKGLPQGYDWGVFRTDDKPLEDKEYPDEADLDRQENEDEADIHLSHCPACRELIHDQAQQCPHCKHWIAERLGDWRASGKWYVRGGLWLTKTLVINWIWGIVAAAAGIIAWLLYEAVS